MAAARTCSLLSHVRQSPRKSRTLVVHLRNAFDWTNAQVGKYNSPHCDVVRVSIFVAFSIAPNYPTSPASSLKSS
jgi:hypothetical protein